MRSISAQVADGTYDIGMGSDKNLLMVTDGVCVAQDCLLASQLLLGEFPYDTTVGVDYMGTLFQTKNPYAFEASVKAALKAVPNVIDVTDFRILQVSDLLQYQATIQSEYGRVVL